MPLKLSAFNGLLFELNKVFNAVNNNSSLVYSTRFIINISKPWNTNTLLIEVIIFFWFGFDISQNLTKKKRRKK